MARNPLKTVRGRLTAATAIVVGVVTIAASVGLYTLSRRALIGDVRETLTENLSEGRDVLNRGVTTELNLLALGVATDPLDQTSRIADETCAPILASAYNDERRPFEDYYYLSGIDDATYVEYDDCILATDLYFEASITCDEAAIDAIGNPTVTFEEFREIYSDGEFDEAYDACLEESLLVDSQLETAAQACDALVAFAYDGIDVLDESMVAAATDAILSDYSSCMRANGVENYPDISSTSSDDFSVLSGVAGSAVLIPSLDSVRASVERFGLGMLIGVPALLLFLGILAWIMVGRALAPVEAIRSRVAEITAEDLDRRVPHPGTSDEIARLAGTMNAMLERLERSADRQRQFVSDASHELGSPLASIHTQLEVALTHPESADWPDVGSGVLAEGLRMERLVDDLLALARADEGAVLARVEPVDVADIALEEAGLISTFEVDTSAVMPIQIEGDSLAIRRVIRNLLDNAVRYAASRIGITVRSGPDGGVTIHVDDDGRGVPEEDRDRVFERFVRLEEARSRDVGGSGLGLAVVWRVVHAHGGTVTISDGPYGGARFTVTVPGRPPRLS